MKMEKIDLGVLRRGPRGRITSTQLETKPMKYMLMMHTSAGGGSYQNRQLARRTISRAHNRFHDEFRQDAGRRPGELRRGGGG